MMITKIKLEDNKVFSLVDPVEVLKKKKLKFFNFDDLKIDNEWKNYLKYGPSVYVFNLKKNCGKTVWMSSIINDRVEQFIEWDNKGRIGEKPKMIVFMRRSEEEFKGIKAEIDFDDNFKYYFKGNKILTKGKISGEDEKTGKPIYANRDIVIGAKVAFNTVYNNRGQQWDGFDTVFWDEYQKTIPPTMQELRNDKDKFITTISNIQRGKKPEELKFFLFGNNEPHADPIREAFGIMPNTTFLANGVILYLNANIWEGLATNNSLALKFAKEMKNSGNSVNFLKDNLSAINEKGLQDSTLLSKGAMLQAYIIGDGIYYSLDYNYSLKQYKLTQMDYTYYKQSLVSFNLIFFVSHYLHLSK